MKKISVIVLEDCTAIASVGAMELFRKSNEIHKQVHQLKDNFFEVELISPRGKIVSTSGGFEVRCDREISELSETDILLIPALEFDIEEKLEKNHSLIAEIKRLYDQGAELGSMCTGAFLLASTGLLDGKAATTHWAGAELFKQMFPEVEMLNDKLIVDSGSIYTCGGATAFMNLVLYLVEKFCGRETAVMTSKMLLLDFDKSPQKGYAIFNPQKKHSDAAIMNAQNRIEENPGKRYSIAELSSGCNLSSRNFIRRFKKHTGITPIEYSQRVKVEEAKRRLQFTLEGFQEITYAMGYADLGTFRTLFKEHTGLTPSAYRAKYKEMVL